MPHDLELWLKKIQSQFEVRIATKDQKKEFVCWKVHIQDPNNRGQAFFIYFDEKGKATLIEMERFHFGWLNIAEGYTTSDILGVAYAILEGRYEIKKGSILRRSKACFRTSRGTVCGKADGRNLKEVQSYKSTG